MFVLKVLSISDGLFCLLKNCVLIGRKYRQLLSCFLSHRRWFWLDIVLYWRQKSRPAILWENKKLNQIELFKDFIFIFISFLVQNIWSW